MLKQGKFNWTLFIWSIIKPMLSSEMSILQLEEALMKTWTKPAVREQEVGLEVTSYLPAEIDLI